MRPLSTAPARRMAMSSAVVPVIAASPESTWASAIVKVCVVLIAGPNCSTPFSMVLNGFVAWNAFSALLNLSMSSLRESGSLLRKVAFPAWAPVLGYALVQMVQVALELSVLVVWFLVIGNVGWSWLYAPFILLALALFSEALGLLLSTANARYGDVQYIVGVVLGALYFLTPVLYPLSFIPEQYDSLKAFIEWQPVSWFVIALHESLYTLNGPGVAVTAALLVFALLTFLGALWVFDRTTEDVGELL